MDVTARTWLLSGQRGAGKTTFCRGLAERGRRAGWRVAGLISPGVFEQGVKTGIRAQDLSSGEVRPLATCRQQAEFCLQVGRWYFDPTVLAWGNQVLRAAAPCDLLLVDELGPLEMTRSAGWSAALDVIRQGGFRLAVVVIRPELCELANTRLPIHGTILLDALVGREDTVETWWRRLTAETDESR